MTVAKMPGMASPCMKRQKSSVRRPGDVAASTVGAASTMIDRTMTRLRLTCSVKAPRMGAASATPSVEALIVRPTAAFEA